MTGSEKNTTKLASMSVAEVPEVSEASSLLEVAASSQPGTSPETSMGKSLSEALTAVDLQDGNREKSTVDDVKSVILTEFTLFNKLAPELRLMVWTQVIEMLGPRVIEVLHTPERGLYTDCPIPAILHVNREARIHALKRFEPIVVNTELSALPDWVQHTLAEVQAPRPTSDGVTPPFATYISYDRDAVYLSLGGNYDDLTLDHGILCSFFRGFQGNLGRLQQVILDHRVVVSVDYVHHLTEILLECTTPKKFLLALSDECAWSTSRDATSAKYPSPHRPITGIENSMDSMLLYNWDPLLGKVSGQKVPEPTLAASPVSWERYLGMDLALFKGHFTLTPGVHGLAEKELWEKLEFSFVNIIRAPAVLTETSVEEIEELNEEDDGLKLEDGELELENEG